MAAGSEYEFRSFDSRHPPLPHDDSLKRGGFAPRALLGYDPLPTTAEGSGAT
jgi:hypothetical protein